MFIVVIYNEENFKFENPIRKSNFWKYDSKWASALVYFVLILFVLFFPYGKFDIFKVSSKKHFPVWGNTYTAKVGKETVASQKRNPPTLYRGI